jgi:hypothetical protein
MKAEGNNEINLAFYSRRHTDFDLRRLVQAKAQSFSQPVTAYLCGAFIKARTGVGIVFDHVRRETSGFFEDGHLIRTSDVVSARREGRFWVLTTENSSYVIATFQRGNGRSSLRDFLRLSDGQYHLSPHLLQ